LLARRCEAAIAGASLAAVRERGLRARVREVRQQASFLVEHLSPHRNAKLYGRAAGAVTVGPLAVAPTLAAEMTFSLKEGEIAKIGVCHEDDVASLAAVAAVRPALGHVLLPAKADRAVAAATALDRDAGPVVEQGLG
jgi:hypothetical protein